MRRLMILVLVAVFSVGVVSVSLAEEGGAAGGQAPAGDMQKAPKKHAKKHKKGKKGKKEGQADETSK